MQNNTMNFLTLSDHPGVRETRILLINGLLNLMMQKPLAEITVKELADFSQVGRRTFYRLYQTKDAIIKDYCRLLIVGYFKTPSIKEKDSVYERLLALFQWCLSNHKTFESLDYKFLLQRIAEEYLSMTHFDVDGLGARGITATVDVAEPLKAYYDLYNLSGFGRMIGLWVDNGMAESPEEMAEICARIMSI